MQQSWIVFFIHSIVDNQLTSHCRSLSNKHNWAPQRSHIPFQPKHHEGRLQRHTYGLCFWGRF